MDDRDRCLRGNAKVGSSLLTHGVIEVGIAEVHNGEPLFMGIRLRVFNDFDGGAEKEESENVDPC